MILLTLGQLSPMPNAIVAITTRSVPWGLLNDLRMVSFILVWVQAVKSSTSLNRERSGALMGCTPSLPSQLRKKR